MKKVLSALGIMPPRSVPSAPAHPSSDMRANTAPSNTRTVQMTSSALNVQQVSTQKKAGAPNNAHDAVATLLSSDWDDPGELHISFLQLMRLPRKTLQQALLVVEDKVKACDAHMLNFSRGYVASHTANDFKVPARTRDTEEFKIAEATYEVTFPMLTRQYERLNCFKEDIRFALSCLKADNTPPNNPGYLTGYREAPSDAELYHMAVYSSETHVKLAHLIVTARSLNEKSPEFKSNAEEIINTAENMLRVDTRGTPMERFAEVYAAARHDPISGAIPENVWNYARQKLLGAQSQTSAPMVTA